MAKPGDVVELRSGVHGLEAPNNLGILLARRLVKGTPTVKIVTLKGTLEVKQDRLTKRIFKRRYEGKLDEERTVLAWLQERLGEHADGRLLEEAPDDLEALEVDLYELAVREEQEVFDEGELATLLFGSEPSSVQRKALLEVLERNRKPGRGRFETAGSGNRWRPWQAEEIAAMRKAQADLAALRTKLLPEELLDRDVEELQEEVTFAAHRGYTLDQGLPAPSDDEKETLAWLERAMRQYVEWDGLPPATHAEAIQGWGGLSAVQVMGMDLHRQLKFLCMDWLASQHVTTSSDYVQFLLLVGLWAPEDAVDALTARHVHQQTHFEFVPDAHAEAEATGLPRPTLDADRTDLRHLPAYTIDPPDAKDFDDAITVLPKPSGWDLYVHIADVAHYVRPGTHLDRAAKSKATSVYLPGRVLPMLPFPLADDLCSLRDDEDRYAMTVQLDVAKDGRASFVQAFQGIIRVTENLHYAQALERKDAGDEAFVQMFDAATAMQTQRRSLGFDTAETRIHLTDVSFETTQKRATQATQMIETFMVAANEAVAAYLTQEGLPVLHRGHGLPERERIRQFSKQMATLGLNLPMEVPGSDGKAKESSGSSLLDQLKSGGGKISFSPGMSIQGLDLDDEEDEDEADDVQDAQGFAGLNSEDQEAWLAPFRAAMDALDTLGARKDAAQIKLLQTMQRAEYTHEAIGHFGLGLNHYVHFTSPIRRYPDLVVHRQLKHVLALQRGETAIQPYQVEDIERMAGHCSEQERAASDLERTVRNACLVLATLQAGQTTLPARVTGITGAGLFVQFDNGIDARVAMRDLPGGPYQVDDAESMLFLLPSDADQRFRGEERASMPLVMDEETLEDRVIRSMITDAIHVKLAGRDVAGGRVQAKVVSWT